MNYDFVIIGASRAGLTAAATLRERVPGASILLLNGEDRPPYKRTNLTKKMAAGFGREDFSLNTPSWYREMNIDLWNGVLATGISPDFLECSDGRKIGWGKILLASGAVPLVPDFPGCEHLLHLRTASDTERIIQKLKDARRVVVVGQGVEGIELAEQCRLLGREVHITGRDKRLMQRWTDERLSERLRRLLEDNGIGCSFSQDLKEIYTEEDTCIIRSTTETLEAEMVLSSTGIRGNPFLAEKLGIYGESGILCDEYLETSVKGVYAAGDAVQSLPGWPRGLWHWAEYQGRLAAVNMTGGREALANIPTRLKTEPFGSFFFSMALQTVIPGDSSKVYLDSEEGYLRIYSRESGSIAALMEGFGKAASKCLEKGIREKTDPDRLAESVLSGKY